MKLQLIISGSLLASLSFGAVFTESFDDVRDVNGNTDLTGLTARGWTVINKSNPAGFTSWYAGETGYVSEDENAVTNTVNAGSNVEYMAANYNNTGNVGTISDYLISPEYAFRNGDSVEFETISDGAAPDRLEMLTSWAGASTNVGVDAAGTGSDFTHVILTVNPVLDPAGYPTVWTKYTATFAGLPGTQNGRFAFHYNVPNGGLSGANSSYIGVDNFKYTLAPEPASMALIGIGLVGLVRRRKTSR